MARKTAALLYVLCIALVSVFPARAAEEFNNLTCVIELKVEQPCNIAIHKRSMVIKFPNGRTNVIRLSKITRWAYTNQSLLRGFLIHSLVTFRHRLNSRLLVLLRRVLTGRKQRLRRSFKMLKLTANNILLTCLRVHVAHVLRRSITERIPQLCYTLSCSSQISADCYSPYRFWS